MQLDRGERRLVRPVLEQLAAALDEVDEQRSRVRAETSEQRQLVRAHEYVHRVDLQHADAIERAPDVPRVDATARPRLGKPLRTQRDAARLRDGHVLDGRGRTHVRTLVRVS